MNFYKNYDKPKQDAFILKYIEPENSKRHRATDGSREPKMVSVKYFIRSITKAENIPVCKSVFLGVLGVSKHRVSLIAKKFVAHGQLPLENRGGDKKSVLFGPKKLAVVSFIKTFKCIESHYCRGKTQVRSYLSSELNIKKMWRMYISGTQDESLKVSHWFFRSIFNTKFNIGFGSPRTDVCSKCLEMKERIKAANNEEEKRVLITESTLHKQRAAAFYSLLKEKKDDLLTLSFDCQKNFALPKIPDQSTYYSRQLYLYNFTIVQGSSKDSLTKNNVFAYTWGEHEYPKGSNEIASAVYHRLQNTNFTGIKNLRCVADGCGGQNKNTTMMFMLQYWLAKHAPTHLKKIEVIFPIPGHSFIPPDRVFAQIEKKLKKIESIVEPQEHNNILSDSGTVFKLGIDYPDYDWKKTSEKYIKPPGSWHFKFAPTKRFFITKHNNKVMVQGEVFYRSELGQRKSVMKANRNITTSRIDVVTLGIAVNPLKLRDVQNLLTKHFGPNWEEDHKLVFYKKILRSVDPERGGTEENCIDDDDDEPDALMTDDFCDHVEDEVTAI